MSPAAKVYPGYRCPVCRADLGDAVGTKIGAPFQGCACGQRLVLPAYREWDHFSGSQRVDFGFLVLAKIVTYGFALGGAGLFVRWLATGRDVSAEEWPILAWAFGCALAVTGPGVLWRLRSLIRDSRARVADPVHRARIEAFEPARVRAACGACGRPAEAWVFCPACGVGAPLCGPHTGQAAPPCPRCGRAWGEVHVFGVSGMRVG